MTKICPKCSQPKDLEEFPLLKNGKRVNCCKECKKKYSQLWNRIHKEQVKKSSQAYYHTHKDKYKKYAQENITAIRERHRQWYHKNKDKARKYYLENQERCKTNALRWNKENPTKCVEYRRRADQKPQRKLIKNISSRIRDRVRELKIKIKAGSYSNVGCSHTQLKQHIESLFQPGMTWDNHGLKGWHIDHIKPISLFDLTKAEEILKANHFSNLQPLWAIDNLHKSAKYNKSNPNSN